MFGRATIRLGIGPHSSSTVTWGRQLVRPQRRKLEAQSAESGVRLWVGPDVVTFRVRRSRGEMYVGHSRLCLSVPRHIPTLLHGPGCKLGEW